MTIVCVVLALLVLAVEAGCRRRVARKDARDERDTAERTTGG